MENESIQSSIKGLYQTLVEFTIQFLFFLDFEVEKLQSLSNKEFEDVDEETYFI